MSRAQLAALLNDRLFHQTSDRRLLGAFKKRVWTPALLRKVVYEAMKYINVPGRVTLDHVALNINMLCRGGLFARQIIDAHIGKAPAKAIATE